MFKQPARKINSFRNILIIKKAYLKRTSLWNAKINHKIWMCPTWHRKTGHKMDDAMEGLVALGMRNTAAILSKVLSRLLRSFPSIGFSGTSNEVW